MSAFVLRNRSTKNRHVTAIRYLAWAAALTSGAVHAAISQVVTSPTSGQISLSENVPITIAWGVATTGGTITSPQGVFRSLNGDVLATITQPLKKSVGAGMAVIPETVRVPETVSIKAKIMGFTDIVYERAFNDGSGTTAGVLPVHIATTTSPGFSISSVAFSFNDNTPLTTAPRGSKLSAQARVVIASNYSGIPNAPNPTAVEAGTGTTATINIRVNGTWEVAGPNPDLKNPNFRPLAEVNQSITGAEPLILKSPNIPTDKTGMYLLRIDFTTPSLEFDEPIVRYYITDK
jgi:hypothetical protein